MNIEAHLASHHASLHVEPWRRREVARNTGRKCEKAQASPGYRVARRKEAKQAVRRDTARQVREALG